MAATDAEKAMPAYSLVPMSREHVPAVSRLHVQGIGGGFLSSLGDEFMELLYGTFIASPDGFGYVAVGDGEVLGFGFCAEDVGRLYQQVLKRHALRFVRAMLPKLLTIHTIRNTFEALLYPLRAPQDLPSAELLAIVVSERARGLGVGRALVDQCVVEFARRGVTRFKVLVGEELKANEFYRRMGFRVVGHYRQHGRVLNLYVMPVQCHDSAGGEGLIRAGRLIWVRRLVAGVLPFLVEGCFARRGPLDLLLD